MYKKIEGITLLELIITIAIVGIVLTAIFSFLSLGNNFFKIGNEKSDLQVEVRLASDFLSDEIRDATSISIITKPGTFDLGYNYLYIDNDGVLKQVKSDGTILNKTEAILVPNIDFFSIRKLANNNNVVDFTLSGTKNNQSYEVSTSVSLSNVKNINATKAEVIKYITPN